MFPLSVRIEINGPMAALVKKRELNAEVLKPSWQAVGVYWARHFWAKHFTEAGAREYGYAPRKGQHAPRGSKRYEKSYTGRKEEEVGHTRPLEYQGELKRQTRRQNIRASPKGVRIIMRSAKARLRHPQSQVDMAEELARVSGGELQQLVAELDRQVHQRLAGYRGRLVKIIQ